MRRAHLVLAALAALACPAGDAGAATVLAWDSQDVTVRPEPSAAEATIEYHFTNRAAVPVTITALKTSCGCTTAKLDKHTFEPGEKGVVTAVFAIGDRFGIQHKRIEVDTDHPDETVIALALTVILPESPVLSPGFLHWQQGVPPAPQTITVTMPAGSPLRILGAIATPPRFAVTAVIAADAHSAVITVVPAHTDTPLTGSVDVACEGGRRFHGFLKVDPAPVPAGGGAAAPQR